MQEYLSIDDFWSDSELGYFEQAARLREGTHSRDRVPPHGPFANQLVSTTITFADDPVAVMMIRDRLRPIFGDDYEMPVLMETRLFLPWDIHCDYYPEDGSPGTLPWYNVLMPLEDMHSRTMIFDQETQASPDFHVYKHLHDKAPNPIDAEFWQQNLSMCWPHDREYVSLRAAMPYQRRGQLQAFRSNRFHSSDNFNVSCPGQVKRFVQIRLHASADLVINTQYTRDQLS
jgi:hypothetical protein